MLLVSLTIDSCRWGIGAANVTVTTADGDKSATFIVSVDQQPIITQQPQSQIITAGQSVTIK